MSYSQVFCLHAYVNSTRTMYLLHGVIAIAIAPTMASGRGTTRHVQVHVLVITCVISVAASTGVDAHGTTRLGGASRRPPAHCNHHGQRRVKGHRVATRGPTKAAVRVARA